MKKTVLVVPDSEQEKAAYALYQRAGFKETERLVTGGYMSALMLAITFTGDQWGWDNFKDSIYIQVTTIETLITHGKKETSCVENYRFYSLQSLEGLKFKTPKEFKEYLKTLEETKLEVRHF